MSKRRFDRLEQLLSWLENHGLATGSWGTGGYKSVENLWDEYQAGDITFEEDPPLRVVQVVQVLIEQGGVFLVEKEQILANGERRFRNQPPSEKMKAGESRLEAAKRCLLEELGVADEQIDFLQVGREHLEEIRESPSYPGLMTRYTIHEVEAHVRGLPATDFWRENAATSQGDPVSRHLWGWVGG